MKLKQRLVAVATVAALAGPMGSANAGYIWPGDYCTTTTVLAGAVVAAVFLMKKKPEEKPDATTPSTDKTTSKSTQLYLKNHQLQMTEELARGEGPVLSELATATHVRTEHMAVYQETLLANSVELIELVQSGATDEAAAARFVQRYVEILQAQPVLAQDLATVG